MKYAFPSDLAEVVVDRWGTFVSRGDVTPPAIPPIQELQRILETIFFASLEREEGRPLQFTVCCAASRTVTRDGTRDRVPMVPLVALDRSP